MKYTASEKIFEKKVRKTMEKYALADRRDKIIVACSGGKDSTVTAYLMKKLGYRTEALHVDLGIGEWSENNRKNLEKFCIKYAIPLHIVDSKKEFSSSMIQLRSVAQLRTGLASCTICGVIRRWLINKKARELCADKLATGHNMDDGAQTVLMNITRGNLHLCLDLGPKSSISKESRFVTKIKPLYFCREEEVRKYSKAKGFPVLYERCPCSFEASRQILRKWFPETEKKYRGITRNIVEYHLMIKPALNRIFRRQEITYCESCGEPTRKKVCKACEFLRLAYR